MRRLQITTEIGCENACSYCPQDKFVKAYKDRSNRFAMCLDSFQTCMEKIPQEVKISVASQNTVKQIESFGIIKILTPAH